MEKMLIKNNITGYIYATSGEVKAFEAFVHVTIANKNTPN
jgi:hypothetical protein